MTDYDIGSIVCYEDLMGGMSFHLVYDIQTDNRGEPLCYLFLLYKKNSADAFFEHLSAAANAKHTLTYLIKNPKTFQDSSFARAYHQIKTQRNLQLFDSVFTLTQYIADNRHLADDQLRDFEKLLALETHLRRLHTQFPKTIDIPHIGL